MNIKNLGSYPPEEDEKPSKEENNRQKDGKSSKEVILLRRAMMLRSLLEENVKDVFINADRDTGRQANIDDDVIDKFLQMKEYKYGIRSMEALVKGLQPINDRLVRASFPPDSQTAHHLLLR